MASLLGSALRSSPRRSLGIDEWLNFFSFDGLQYPILQTQTLGGGREEKIAPTFPAYAEAGFAGNGPVFACMLVRMLLFAEIRLSYRRFNQGRPGDLWSNADLDLFKKPWPNGTMGDLAARAISDVDLTGNFFLAKRQLGRGTPPALRRMRPDWTTIVMGSKSGHELDMEPAGYIYEPKNGLGEADTEPMVLLPEEVAHFAPVPDPLARFRGMSWLTPVLREIMADRATTAHKLKFFENGATPNMVVKFDPMVNPEMFDKWVDRIEERHAGLSNAYKTLYLGGGGDPTVIGSNMRDIDLTGVQGAGETRIAAAAGVPPVLVGLSEGLKAATYSNYQQATRRLADVTMRPLWRNFAGSMAPLVKVPVDSELWYDDRDIAFLKEDAKDAAQIQNKNAVTITSLVNAGFTPESSVAAVEAGDMTLLAHSGLLSVQLWKPGEGPDSAKQPDPTAGGESDKKP